jgi:hypothetical protein
MSNRLNSLIARTNKALAKTNAFDRKVYLRTTTTSGGDSLLGRYGSISITDSLLVPQPFVERLGRERVPGGHVSAETIIVGSSMKIGDDYTVLASASMLSLSQLQNPQCQIVFKDQTGNMEILSILDFETISIDSGDLAYNVYCRSAVIA